MNPAHVPEGPHKRPIGRRRLPTGAVNGIERLRVSDASIIAEVPTVATDRRRPVMPDSQRTAPS
jgi:hypothetical protein